MPEKTQWEIEQLRRESDEQDKKLTKHEVELRELRSFRDSTVEKLITIFNTIDEMKEESRWLKRAFTNMLVGGIVTVIGSLVVWLITT